MSAAEVEAARGIIRTASRESFYFFAKVVCGFSLLTNQTHRKWANDLQGKIFETRRFMRLKPRGTFKTTLYGIAFLLWVWACWSKEIRFFYTSANALLLDEVGAELDRLIGAKAETLVATVFDLRRDVDAKNTSDVFNIVGRSESKGFSLIMRTAGGSTNGVHPHVIVIDDPMDKDDRTSAAVRAGKVRWMDSLRPLLVPFDLDMPDGRKTTLETMMFIATRWHMQDLVSHITSKRDHKWDVETEGVYLADGTPRYPELLPETKIGEIREDIDSVFFACQYLNDPLPEGSRIFAESRLHYLRRDQFDVTKGTNYCFLDPSQGKQGGDFPAVIWVNVLNGRKVIFDAIDKKIELTSLLAMIATKNREYKTRLLRFETNGTMGLESSIRLAHKDARYSGITVEGMHETRSKEERIYAMQPELYRAGGWHFVETWRDDYPELMNQLLYFPAWEHDDFPDVIEKAVTWMATNLPNPERWAALGRI